MKNQNSNSAKPKDTGSKGGNVTPIHEVRGNGKQIFKFLMFGVLALAFIFTFTGKAIGAKTAALYLLGNDGKISGRTSGDVYMRNGRKRGFRVPALVRNSYTGAVRSIFSAASSAWRNLTTTQIAAWNTFILKTSDRFGRIVDVKGKTAYVRINANLRNSGQVMIDDAPVGAAVPSNTHVVTVTTGVGASTFDITYTTNPVGKYMVLSATKCFNIGTNRPSKSQFRNIAIVDSSVAGPADVWAAYVAKFGTPTVGQQVFLQWHVVGGGTGLASAKDQFVALIAA